MKTMSHYPITFKKHLRLLFAISAFLCFTIVNPVFAQTPGSLDLSFNPGTGMNSSVNTITLQPDGKVLTGGYFTTFNGAIHNRIVRLNADGSLDNTFNQGAGGNSWVLTTALQTNGKLIIGGSFTNFNGTGLNRICRLNANGSLDNSFNIGTGANDVVYTTALQPDGKVIIGGAFTNYNGTAQNRIARLNADGSLDATFNSGTGASHTVYSINLQPDGKVIIGGFFYAYNSTTRYRVARLNTDGSLDNTFNPSMNSTMGFVYTTALQPDGKLIVGGDVSSYSGTSQNYITRLNANGSLDVSFNPGTGANNVIHDIKIQPDGKILASGVFWQFNGQSHSRLVRMNVDGSVDASFQSTGVNERIFSMALQPDGKVIIGGQFTDINGTSRNRIARILGHPCTAPSITQQPVGATVCPGVSHPFSVIASGTGPLSYQWKTGTPPVNVGTNSANYTTSSVGNYQVVVSNACGSVTSSWASLSNHPAPPTTPTVASSNLSHTVCSDGPNLYASLSWTSGNGAKRLVLASLSPIANLPVSGTTYTANATYGQGSHLGNGVYVVADGSGSNTVVTFTSSPQTIYFAVIEYNDLCGTPKYRTSSYASLTVVINQIAYCPGGGSGDRIGSTNNFSTEKSELDLSVFPNPNNGLFQLELNSTNDKKLVRYRVLSVTGKVELTGSFNGNYTEVDMREKSPGLYFIHLNDGTSQTIRKMVIE